MVIFISFVFCEFLSLSFILCDKLFSYKNPVFYPQNMVVDDKNCKNDFNDKVSDWKSYIKKKKTTTDDEEPKKPKTRELREISLNDEMLDAPVLDDTGEIENSYQEKEGETLPSLFGTNESPEYGDSDESEDYMYHSGFTSHKPRDVYQCSIPFWKSGTGMSGYTEVSKGRNLDVDTPLINVGDGGFKYNSPDDHIRATKEKLFGIKTKASENIANNPKEELVDEQKKECQDETDSSELLGLGGYERPLQASPTETTGDLNTKWVEKTVDMPSQSGDLAVHPNIPNVLKSSFGSFKKWGSVPSYMNGTIPFDESNEVLNHLESRIKMQDIQISNYKDTIRERDIKISLLEKELHMMRETNFGFDQAFIEDRVRRGLDIVEELIASPSQVDFSEELDRERIKNMAYQTIVAELTERIKDFKERE